MLLNPRRMVIGGGISKAGDRLFEPLRQELRRQITSWSAARIDVVPAALGDDSVLYGALALARRGAGALAVLCKWGGRRPGTDFRPHQDSTPPANSTFRKS